MKNFVRVFENFTCFHCGAQVKGTGYTDHCPKCLWSKHVDNTPGDRANVCGGAMEPIRTVFQRDSYMIYYRCKKCGEEKRFKATKDDSLDEIMKLVKHR